MSEQRYNTLTREEQEAGYRLLFDGHSLEGWDYTGLPGGWSVEDGAIVCLVNGGRFLFTREHFDDFVVSVDFRTESGVNSGILFRVHDLSRMLQNALEMQILDTFEAQTMDKFSCGAVYGLLEPAVNAARRAGEWNTAVITCIDSQIRITLNGLPIINMDLNDWDTPGCNPDGTAHKFVRAFKELPRKGRIVLQDHGGKVWFRNIKLRPLDRNSDSGLLDS
jgi:hypothetical protein